MIDKKAIIYVSAISFVIAIVKLIVGIISNSISVLASAVDSILDTLVSLFNLFAISKAKEIPNKTFNYGVGKIEALATIIEGAMIFISGGYIIFASIKKYFTNDFDILLDVSIYVIIISIIVAIINVSILKYAYKKTNNLIIKTDITHYKVDIWANIGILVSLFLILWTDIFIIDIFVGSLIGLYILYSAVSLIKDGIFNILDGSLEEDILKKIQDIITTDDKSNGYHLLKTRSSASINFVEFHLELHPEIMLYEAYEISKNIEKKIENIDTNKKWIITVRLDPYSKKEHKNIW